MSKRFLFSILGIPSLFFLGQYFLVFADTVSSNSETSLTELPSDNVVNGEPVDTEPADVIIGASPTALVSEEMTATSDSEFVATDSSVTPGGLLSSLTDTVVGLFTTKNQIALDTTTETVVIYELDQPVILSISLKKIWPAAVTRTEAFEKPRLVGGLLRTISSWLVGDASTTPGKDATSPTDTNELDTSHLEEINTPPGSPVSWWRNLFSHALAAEVASISTTTATEGATSSDQEIPLVSDTPSSTLSTSSASITPWLRVGSTPVAGELVYLPAVGTTPASYQLLLPPGSVPLGLQEVFVSTTTPDGLIDERFVIDMGGGTVRAVAISSTDSILITTREDGKEALWRVVCFDAVCTYEKLVDYNNLRSHSPLAIFDATLFVEDITGTVILGYTFANQSLFSLQIDSSRPTIVELTSGTYAVTPTDTDFLFVAAEVVY